MAIKFEDKPGDRKNGKAAADRQADVKARFATPIEASEPVNPDATSELPFAKPVRPEKKGRRK